MRPAELLVALALVAAVAALVLLSPGETGHPYRDTTVARSGP